MSYVHFIVTPKIAKYIGLALPSRLGYCSNLRCSNSTFVQLQFTAMRCCRTGFEKLVFLGFKKTSKTSKVEFRFFVYFYCVIQ